MNVCQSCQVLSLQMHEQQLIFDANFITLQRLFLFFLFPIQSLDERKRWKLKSNVQREKEADLTQSYDGSP